MVTNSKEERKKWDKNYREKNSEKVKESQKKYQDSDGGKKKRKKWRDDNPEKILERDRRYRKNNPESGKKRGKKYYYTLKGTASMLRKHDARRLGIKISTFTWKTLEIINNRDRECVYCRCEFENNINYDHINPFKECSKNNIVRSCVDCNKDKSRANMIEWMNFKKYKISQKLLDLYKKAYE